MVDHVIATKQAYRPKASQVMPLSVPLENSKNYQSSANSAGKVILEGRFPETWLSETSPGRRALFSVLPDGPFHALAGIK